MLKVYYIGGIWEFASINKTLKRDYGVELLRPAYTPCRLVISILNKEYIDHVYIYKI